MKGVRLVHAECVAEMRAMAERGEVVQAIVTDPPYHLTSIVKRFGKPGSAPPKHKAYAAFSHGFMGQEWDGGDIAFQVETWRAAYDLLPPGGHLVAFSGTRTYHRMVCAIEDAGFEIRDQLSWLYGSGFNKKGYIRDSDGEILRPGWAGALKPAHEPICLARKHLSGTVAETVLAHGTGALNVDACRIGLESCIDLTAKQNCQTSQAGHTVTLNIPGHSQATYNAAGRWPANVLHDGSDEVEAAFAEFGERTSGAPGTMRKGVNDGVCYGAESRPAGTPMTGFGDSGSASRFFASFPPDALRFHYSAKADAADRHGSSHPTVKPVALMRWLVRLITPPGGTVLDPFAGTGTTGLAAFAEGFQAVLIEREAEYVADIQRRMDTWSPDKALPAVGKQESADTLPLFGGAR